MENVRARRGGPFGAVIVRGGKVIAEGVNLVTSTPDPTAHAEVVAIRKAAAEIGSHVLAGCEIYASCEPCPMCLGAIYWAHLDSVCFAASEADAAAAGFDDAFLYRELAAPAEARRIPARRMLAREGVKPFRAWRESASKVPY